MTTQVTGSGVNFNGSTSGTILLTQPAVAGTTTFNGNASAWLYGGSVASSITITEVVP